MEDISLKRINGLNRLLVEIYKNDKLISHILSEEGFSKPELLEIKFKLDIFMNNVLALLANRYNDRSDCERLSDVIIKRYALFDGKIYTLEEIGILYGISRERVRQLQEKGKKRIKMYLRKIIIDSASSLLGKKVDDKIHITLNKEVRIYLSRAMNSLGLSEAYPWVRSNQLANELYKSEYLEAKIYAGKLQFFPSAKGLEIGLRCDTSESHSRVYLEENAQLFIANFVNEKFASNK